MNTPRVAVCLAAYQGVDWLEEQVASILSQSDVEVTLFISVDRSDDGTESLVNELASDSNRMVALPQGQRFGSACQNFLHVLREAPSTGFDYYALADQDDIWLSDKLIHAIQTMTVRQVSAYSSDVMAFWPDGTERMIVKSQPQASLDHFFEAPGPGCTFVIQASLFNQLQSLLRHQRVPTGALRYHDWFIYAAAREMGHQWTIDDESRMKYRQHSQNVQGANIGIRHKISRLSTFLSGDWIQESITIATILARQGSENAHQLIRQVESGRLGLLQLALSARSYRRKPFEQMAFFILCLLLALKGYKPRSD